MSHKPTTGQEVNKVDASTAKATANTVNYSDLPLFGYCASDSSNLSISEENNEIKVSEKPPSPIKSNKNTANSRKSKAPKSAPETSMSLSATHRSQEVLQTNSVLLTVSDICKLLKISRSTLIRMEKSGQLPGRLMLGGSVRYHRETIDAWLRGLATNPS